MLKKLLQTKGVKQKWLANKIVVSEVTVINMVKEKTLPSDKNYQKMNEALNVSLKDLME
jgi:ribosome-binding protein aMBF1 (putative translation factor)